MPAHVECAKRTLNMLAVLAKNCNVFYFRTSLLRIPLVFQKLLTKNPYC